MNKFVGWDLTDVENEKCGKCGMTEDATKKGCCKDEHKLIKLTVDQNKQQAKIFLFEQFFTEVLLTLQYIYIFMQPARVAVKFPKNNAPPRWRNVPIYLSNCVFLI